MYVVATLILKRDYDLTMPACHYAIHANFAAAAAPRYTKRVVRPFEVDMGLLVVFSKNLVEANYKVYLVSNRVFLEANRF